MVTYNDGPLNMRQVLTNYMKQLVKEAHSLNLYAYKCV